MADQSDFTFSFEIKSLPTDTTPPPEFHVVSFEGEEEISGSYRFALDLACEQPDVDLRRLLLQPGTLMVTNDSGARKFHGIISEAVQGGEASPGSYSYRVELRPAMWKLGLSRQSQIHGTLSDVSVIDVVRTELTGAGALGPGDLSSPHLDADDVAFRVIPEEYPLRDYIVQYQESDLDFVCRQLEHYGIFYFFDHSGEREKLILGDSNAAFNDTAYLTEDAPSGQAPLEVRYQISASDSLWFGRSIFSLQCRSQPLPRTLMVRDYNYRLRREPYDGPYYLAAEADVDPAGHGIVVNYGEHFKDELEGTTLARARAEELLCRQTLYTGAGDTIAFSAGHVFSLTDHFRNDLNQNYVITRVRHLGRPSNSEEAPVMGGAMRYTNEFTAIPASVPFRPERKTPKPVVPGLFNAHVDAAGTGQRAEIDSEGRYKIRTPFDLSGYADGTASRYMRRAQPYAGLSGNRGSTGFHFPLLKGTEVVCACVNGDPDRPIIAGAVPNPKTATPVTQTNATKNLLRTTSGVRMEFDDARPRQEDSSQSSSGDGSTSQGGSLPSQTHYQRVDKEASVVEKIVNSGELPKQRHLAISGPFTVSGPTEAVEGKSITLTVTAAAGTSYLDVQITPTDPNNAIQTPTISRTNSTEISITINANSVTDDQTVTLSFNYTTDQSAYGNYTAYSSGGTYDITVLAQEYDVDEPLWKVHVPNLAGTTYYWNSDEDQSEMPSDDYWASYVESLQGTTVDIPRSYVRRGTADTTEPAEGAYYESAAGTSDYTEGSDTSVGSGYGTRFSSSDRPGGFDYIDGDRIEWTSGNRDIIVGGKHRFVIVTGGLNVWDAFPLYLQKTWQDHEEHWHSSTIEAGLSESVKLSDSKSFDLSSSSSFKIGIDTSAALAASFSASAGISSSLNLGASWSWSKDESLNIAKKSGTNVHEEIKLEVQSDPSWRSHSSGWTVALAGIVAGGTAMGAALGTTNAGGDSDDQTVKDMHVTFEVLRGVCLALFAATLAHGLLRKSGITKTEILMDQSSIKLAVKDPTDLSNETDASYVEILEDQITIFSPKVHIMGGEVAQMGTYPDGDTGDANMFVNIDANDNKLIARTKDAAGLISLQSEKSIEFWVENKNQLKTDGTKATLVANNVQVNQ
jgi:type VI secretion system VgrG family protein